MCLFCLSIPQSTHELIQPLEAYEKPVVIEKKVLNPVLKRVCSCESKGNPYSEPQQFHSDGTVVRGVINPQDVGMCQINLDYHEKSAIKMNIDLFTEQGNITYANHLYDTQGLQPWSASSKCWSIALERVGKTSIIKE